jgi:hypothetical protein
MLRSAAAALSLLLLLLLAAAGPAQSFLLAPPHGNRSPLRHGGTTTTAAAAAAPVRVRARWCGRVGGAGSSSQGRAACRASLNVARCRRRAGLKQHVYTP